MAIFLRGNNGLLPRISNLIKLQTLRHALANGEVFRAPIYPGMDFHSDSRQAGAYIDMSKWRKVDGRVFGINRSMIPSPSWTVLKILHSKGFETYLVGGCVRDLLLNRVPKDFDVITTAGLKQIRKQFNRARIVGRRFPICMVNIKGSVIEVSSFETIAKDVKENNIDTCSQIPKKCDKKDLIRWRNSMYRDFTINSLFFDPFLNIIYDYAEGIADLRSLKLRTLIPASLSFKEDCARILRGLRIAARLGLSFSKDTETAISRLSTSIMSLDKSRIMMELNYMLSYGAAAPSLRLLQRFNLLKILLPFHAAYLDEQSTKKDPLSSIMLMKLFLNLDKLVSCDRPSDCNLWVGLLAFHMALVNNPQDSLTIMAFAATLYHGDWNKAVNFSRENSQVQVKFKPEIISSAQYKSDEELVRGVAHFASIVQGSIDALTTAESLTEAMSDFIVSPFSPMVFVPKRTVKDVAEIFEVLVNDIESYEFRRENFEIDYRLLGRGILSETRFVIGMVILETLNSVIVQGGRDILDENKNLCNLTLSDLVNDQLVTKKYGKTLKRPCSSEIPRGVDKKYKSVEKDKSHSYKMVESRKCTNMTEKHQAVVETLQSPDVEFYLEQKSSETAKVRPFKAGRTENNQKAHEAMRDQVKERIQHQEADNKGGKKLPRKIEGNPTKKKNMVIVQESKSERDFTSGSQGLEADVKSSEKPCRMIEGNTTRKGNVVIVQEAKSEKQDFSSGSQGLEADDKSSEKLCRTVEGDTRRKRNMAIVQEKKSEKKEFSSKSQGHNKQNVRTLSSIFK